MHVPKLAKNAVVKIRIQVKNALASILDLDINSEARQRLDSFYIPIHGGLLKVVRSCRDFRHLLQVPNRP